MHMPKDIKYNIEPTRPLRLPLGDKSGTVIPRLSNFCWPYVGGGGAEPGAMLAQIELSLPRPAAPAEWSTLIRNIIEAKQSAPILISNRSEYW